MILKGVNLKNRFNCVGGYLFCLNNFLVRNILDLIEIFLGRFFCLKFFDLRKIFEFVKFSFNLFEKIVSLKGF